MINYFLKPWSKPFDFKGKSNRREYWYFYFLNYILIISLKVIQSFLHSISNNFDKYYNNFNLFLYSFDVFILLIIFGFLWISIPLTLRRIRDVGMNWRWIFICLIPYFGQIYAIIFLTRSSVIDLDGKKYYPKY